jgi:hypothetical protein
MSLLEVLHFLPNDYISYMIPPCKSRIFKKISKYIYEKSIKFIIHINFNASINNMFSITEILNNIIKINKIYDISVINLTSYFMTKDDVIKLVNIINNNNKSLEIFSITHSFMRINDIEITLEALSKCLNITEIRFNYMSINISNSFLQNLSKLKKLKLLDLKYCGILQSNNDYEYEYEAQKIRDILPNCKVLS